MNRNRLSFFLEYSPMQMIPFHIVDLLEPHIYSCIIYNQRFVPLPYSVMWYKIFISLDHSIKNIVQCGAKSSRSMNKPCMFPVKVFSMSCGWSVIQMFNHSGDMRCFCCKQHQDRTKHIMYIPSVIVRWRYLYQEFDCILPLLRKKQANQSLYIRSKDKLVLLKISSIYVVKIWPLNVRMMYSWHTTCNFLVISSVTSIFNSRNR